MSALALLVSLAASAGPTEGPCARSIRDYFDQAGREVARGLPESALAGLERTARAHPERCGSGDYAAFANRYADLLALLASGGFTDAELRLAAISRLLAPRRVAPAGYEAAFRAYLDARSRLVAHLPAASAAQGMSLYDEVRPDEALPLSALGGDREGVLTGLTEIRRLLALGEVAAADQRAEELMRALQAPLAPAAPDAGPPAPPDAGPPAPAPASDAGQRSDPAGP